MTITYIVGNGFDLGLGLKTSYNDFIRDFLKVPTEGAEFVSFAKAHLRDEIGQDIETWANAEIAFAQMDFGLIFEDSPDKRTSILKLIDSFKEDLSKYLSSEERRFFPVRDLQETSELFKERIVKALYEGERGLSSGRGLNLARERGRKVVNVINLNYTATFDYLFWGRSEGGFDIPFGCDLDDGAHLELNIGNVHHVHGSLTGNNTLFGVSSASQVKDADARALAEYSGSLVKSSMDKEENSNRYSAALDDLNASDVIVLFGVSFGASDKLWWRKLSELLLSNEQLRIYIFPYSHDPISAATMVGRSSIRAEWRQKLFSSIRAEFTDSEFARIQENMYKVVVLPFGPYKKYNGQMMDGDPWDLSYFSSCVITR